jgi:ketohexokinase
MEEFLLSEMKMSEINWVHFEGRIPEVLVAVIPWLKSKWPDITISIEFEKYGRPGLIDLLLFADVAVFSHTYFVEEGKSESGIITPSDFCKKMRRRNAKATIIITLGEHGAFYSSPFVSPQEELVPTRKVDVVDSTGAGDTFIAAFIWAVGKLKKRLPEAVQHAVFLASRKVSQEGFDGVWE